MRTPRRSPSNTPCRLAPGAVLLAAALLTAGCVTDTIEDRRYGQQVVCHDGKTITVSNADSFVHLDHGDTLGPCPTG